FRASAAAVRRLPGVLAVGAGSAISLSGGDGEEEFVIEGRPPTGPAERPSAAWFDADTDYFHTLGVPLLRGRPFTDQDRAGAPPVAVINETMARRFWPDGNPLGQRLSLQWHRETIEVIGVVRDVQPFRPDERPGPQMFWPFAQFPRWAVQLVIRTARAPGET